MTPKGRGAMAELRELDGLRLAVLRGGGPAFLAAAAGALGAGLPEAPNSRAGQALWPRPGRMAAGFR